MLGTVLFKEVTTVPAGIPVPLTPLATFIFPALFVTFIVVPD